MSQETNIHLIIGEDDYLVETTARKILDAAVPPELRDHAVEKIDGMAGNIELQHDSLKKCRESLMAPPFLAPVKLTWWRNVTFLPVGGTTNLSDVIKTELEQFAKDLAKRPLPSNQIFILTAPKMLASSVFAKTMKTLAEVVVFASETRARIREQAACALLPDLAAEAGLKFEPGADRSFIAKVGFDTRRIISELEKLRAYLGKDSDLVTRAAVADISSIGTPEPELWELTDAVGERNASKFLSLLNRLGGKSGIGILLSTVMERFFRELIVCRDALDHGWLTSFGSWEKNLPEDVMRHLNEVGLGPEGGTPTWKMKHIVTNARAFTPRELQAARFRMVSVREKIVSSMGNDALVKTEILRIIARPRTAVRRG